MIPRRGNCCSARSPLSRPWCPVQVRLHCELRRVVLGGECGSGAALHEGSAGSGDASRFLQLWDYEGSLSGQVREAA